MYTWAKKRRLVISKEMSVVWAGVMPPFDDVSRNGGTIDEHSNRKAVVNLQRQPNVGTAWLSDRH